MRRVFLVTIAVIALGVALAGVALANAGPHGGYVALEDKCASCHRAHTGGIRLTVGSATSVYAVCASCHDGTSSYVNVLDGVLLASWSTRSKGSGQKLLGGGFEYFNSGAVGSSHNVSGATFAWTEDPSKAWGFQAKPGVSNTLTDGPLDCGSCHDPHGNTNYAILRSTINNIGISVYPTRGVTLPADDSTNRTVRHVVESYGWGSSFTASGITYSGFNGLCGACHTGYLATTLYSGSGAAPSGVYTHRVGMRWNEVPSTIGVRAGNPETSPLAGMTIPLADVTNQSAASGGVNVTCLSCHFAHGTTAAMSGAAVYNNSSSALLRIANRGTCQGCHEK